MTAISADPVKGAVSFKVSRPFYSEESVAIAARVFESRAEVRLAETRKDFRVALKAKGKRKTAAELESLAGEFLNELLNQEYRLVVARSNARVAELIVTQALYCAGGGDGAARSRDVETSPEFKAGVDRLLRDARDEIKAQMPRKVSA